jgi:hypothetical protein
MTSSASRSAVDVASASSCSVIAPVPSLQAGHCPHDSTYRKRDTSWASSTALVVSSYTMNPHDPSPEPIASIPS